MSDFYRKKSGAFFSFLRRRGIYIAVVVLLAGVVCIAYFKLRGAFSEQARTRTDFRGERYENTAVQSSRRMYGFAAVFGFGSRILRNNERLAASSGRRLQNRNTDERNCGG